MIETYHQVLGVYWMLSHVAVICTWCYCREIEPITGLNRVWAMNAFPGSLSRLNVTFDLHYHAHTNAHFNVYTQTSNSGVQIQIV